MKLWEKGQLSNQTILDFTAGNDRALDQEIIQAELIGSVAHAKMLEKIGLLSKEESQDSLRVLKCLFERAKGGKVALPPEAEDVHSFVEHELTAQLGETGKRIHAGRSRNDQVLLDMRLFLREETATISKKTFCLFEDLIKLAEKHKNHLMPGYTHMQAAMPSSFGLWFSAWAESLTDDLLIMQAAYRIINQNPLGSGAGYGSSLPLDRELTTELLGFDHLNVNSIYAQMGRGKTEKVFAWGMSSIAASLAKLAGDICLYSGQNYGFFSMPEAFTTGSSIMPHKKNPDAWELIRGRCNKIQNLPAELSMICINLPTGYHRDYQLLKESLFPSIRQLKDCLDMAAFLLQHLQVNTNVINDGIYNDLFSVEAVNQKVKNGMPFRQAYQEVAESIRNKQFKPDKQLDHTHIGSIGNLSLDRIESRMKEVLQAFNFEKADQAISNLMKTEE